jgi:hypothetical protein
MRFIRLRLLPALGVFLAIGCADQPSAPEASSSVETVASLKIIPSYAADMKSAQIIVEPSGGVFVLGPHAIYFPANTICDPETSSYGPTEWDRPCDTIDEPIEIHVKLVERDGRSWLDFSPSLRFKPSKDENRWVYLFMSTDYKLFRQKGGIPPILWSPAIGVPGVDESLLDRTQKTQWSSQHNGVYRRIKHFSGYNVHQGFQE